MSELKKKIEQNRKNGKLGGEQTARLHGADFCEERARVAGQTCLLKYGREFYRSIRAMRVS
jgi:hypothetical protein